MAFVDRLKPKYRDCEFKSLSTPVRSAKSERSQSRADRPTTQSRADRSPTQSRAKAIVKKYKRQVRQAEFQRLQSIIPTVREDDEATEETILAETMKYIDDLHHQLLERIHTKGLPLQLRRVAEDTEDNPNTFNMDQMKELLGKSIHPKLEASFRQRRAEEKVKIKHLIQANELGHQAKVTFHGSRPE